MKLVPLLLKEIMCIYICSIAFSCVNKPKVENISPLKMKLTSFLDTFYHFATLKVYRKRYKKARRRKGLIS